MITTQLTNINDLFDRLDNGTTVENEIKTLDPISASATRWAEEFRIAQSQFRLLEQKGLLTPDEMPDSAKLLKALEQVRKKLEADPLTVTKGNTFSTFRKHAETILEAVQKRIKEKWNAWFGQTVTSIPDAMIAPYEREPQYKQYVRAIRDKNRELQRLQRQVPESALVFAEVEQLVESRGEDLKQLPTSAPPVVKAFLDAALLHGATLDQLTPEVLAWLQENDQVNHFRIRRQ